MALNRANMNCKQAAGAAASSKDTRAVGWSVWCRGCGWQGILAVLLDTRGFNTGL